MAPTSNAIDMTNQNAAVVGSAPLPSCDFRIIIVGTIPVVSRFIDNNSGMKVLVSERA